MCFESNEVIEKVMLSYTVREIGDYAFYDCLSLTNVILHCTDVSIGEYALGYYYISRKENGVVSGFTIEGYAGSTAQVYAESSEEITFVALQNLIVGDANEDGMLDVKDLVRIKKILARVAEETENADVNQDIVITLEDIERLRKILIG